MVSVRVLARSGPLARATRAVGDVARGATLTGARERIAAESAGRAVLSRRPTESDDAVGDDGGSGCDATGGGVTGAGAGVGAERGAAHAKSREASAPTIVRVRVRVRSGWPHAVGTVV
jgi:hypothetical protein